MYKKKLNKKKQQKKDVILYIYIYIYIYIYSTGNFIQYSTNFIMINHNEKEYEKEYMCITESLCCTAEIKHNVVSLLYFNKT